MSESKSHLDGDPKASQDGIQRRLVLGSALRVLAIGGLAAGGIAGCASSTRQLRTLPDPDLPSAGRVAGSARRRLPVTPEARTSTGMPGVLSRGSWTSDAPNYSRMDKHTRQPYCITIHHDGLPWEDRPYTSTGTSAARARLQLYRQGHVGHNGWADIGYHYAIDRAGRVWECRPLAYQGAHVRGRNDGNIGILVMGNFEVQRPSSAQVRALGLHVNALCRAEGIADKHKKSRVLTHKEWKGAKTQCPGRHLQAQVTSLRARNFRA